MLPHGCRWVAFGLRRVKMLGYLSLQLISEISNPCAPDPPTLQTNRQTDRLPTCNRNTALCTLLVKLKFLKDEHLYITRYITRSLGLLSGKDTTVPQEIESRPFHSLMYRHGHGDMCYRMPLACMLFRRTFDMPGPSAAQ